MTGALTTDAVRAAAAAPASEAARRLINSVLFAPAPKAAQFIAERLTGKYPGAGVFLYGSGISVSADENPTEILFDYYVIVPNYADAIANQFERFAARALPPNVYYFENESPFGLLRAKYALLSIDAFERLVSQATFHSYFWARFAQPSRIVIAPADMRARLEAGVITAIETFIGRSRAIAAKDGDWRDVWLAGLNASYKAELRAETSDRAARLIDNYGAWPQAAATIGFANPMNDRPGAAAFGWKMRAFFGGFLSVARLLKATTTFQGGIDYIAWKIKRHAGIEVAIKPWERRRPFIAAPIVAARYYKMRAAAKKDAGQ